MMLSSNDNGQGESMKLAFRLSPNMQLAYDVMGENYRNGIIQMITDAVMNAVQNEEIANSLRAGDQYGTPVREVDVLANNQVIIKCFVGWSETDQIWSTYCEYGNEDHWEKLYGSVNSLN